MSSGAETGSSGAGRPRLASAAVLLLSLLAVAAAFELLARTAFPLAGHPPGAEGFTNPEVLRYDGPVHWTFQPGTTAFDRHERLSYAINSIGFRSHEKIIEGRLLQGVRIIAVGDSCVFGLRSRWGFPVELQIGLDEKAGRKTFEVIDAGVPGYSSEQVLRQARTLIPAYKPDVLALSVGWEDASPPLDGALADEVIGRRGQRATEQIKAFLTGSGLARMVSSLRGASGGAVAAAGESGDGWRALLRDSCSAVLDGVDDPLAPLLTSVPPPPARVPLDRFESNLLEIHELCVLHGARLVFVPVSCPAPYVAVMRQLSQKKDIPLVETELAFYSDYRRQVVSKPGETRRPADMRRDTTLFSDGRHPTILGHIIAGRALRQGLMEQRMIGL